MSDLVIGSNSYLGINLCAYLDPDKSWLISKSANDALNSRFKNFLAVDLVNESLSQDRELGRIFILARPVSGSKELLDQFYENIFEFLKRQLAKKGEIEVHFASTTLVYSSEENVRISVITKPKPRDLYERQKLLFEQELFKLTERHPKASINIHRLPILVGGIIRANDKQRQWLPYFYSLFRKGLFWNFEKEAEQFGTSWLDVQDFAEWMATGKFESGFKIWLPSSGDITYYKFMHESKKRLLFRPKRGNTAFPRSYLFVEPNVSLSQKDVWESFNP